MHWAVASVIAALVLVGGVAGNIASASLSDSLWARWGSPGTRAIAVLGLGGLAFGSTLAVSRLTSSGSTGVAVSDLAWDSQGLRSGIVYRDSFSPWKDEPIFDAVLNEPSTPQDPKPVFEDERYFIVGVVAGRDSAWSRSLKVKAGDTVEIQCLVANEAEPELNAVPGKRGVARETRVALGYSDAASRSPWIFGVISAANASPHWIAARLELQSPNPVRLKYVPGSGRLHVDDKDIAITDLAHVGPPSAASSIAPLGALVGRPRADGLLPAGWDRAVYVTASFRVT